MAEERDGDRVAPEPLTEAAMHLERVREAQQTIADAGADADDDIVAGWAEETLAVMVAMSESLAAAWEATATAMERVAGLASPAVDGPGEPDAEALLEPDAEALLQPTSFLDDLTRGDAGRAGHAA